VEGSGRLLALCLLLFAQTEFGTRNRLVSFRSFLFHRAWLALLFAQENVRRGTNPTCVVFPVKIYVQSHHPPARSLVRRFD
jgi:hypothetical protein